MSGISAATIKLNYEVLTALPVVAALAPEWNALLARSACNRASGWFEELPVLGPFQFLNRSLMKASARQSGNKQGKTQGDCQWNAENKRGDRAVRQDSLLKGASQQQSRDR